METIGPCEMIKYHPITHSFGSIKRTHQGQKHPAKVPEYLHICFLCGNITGVMINAWAVGYWVNVLEGGKRGPGKFEIAWHESQNQFEVAVWEEPFAI